MAAATAAATAATATEPPFRTGKDCLLFLHPNIPKIAKK
jgi:hypothetical protein